MAVVVADKKKIVIPYPTDEQYRVLDQVCVTHILTLPNGDRLLALPHNLDTLRILKNMEIPTEGCGMFESYYTPPKNIRHPEYSVWWWQMETAAFLASNPRAFVTSTPRTGKTLSTLMAVDYVLREVGGAALIVAPLTVANGGEWEKTCHEWFPHKRVQMVHKDRHNELRRRADIYLINPAGLKICEDMLEYMTKHRIITVAVFDELTEFANVKSQQTKAAMAIAKHADYRWGLTGTPGKPEKIYGQVKLINPNNVPAYYTRWRDLTMVQITQFKWVPKHGHEEVIEKAMTPCIRYDKKDILDIPLPQVITEQVELSPQQEKITKELVDEMRVMVEGNEINAVTASTLAQKLLQVAGGAVKVGDDVVRVDVTPKLAKLDELLRRTPAKKVIFSSFIAINDMLVEHVRASGMTCEKIDGSVMGERRKEILHDFMESDSPHVLVCHPRTTAFGVELASADMIICYGTPMAGAFMYQQLFERLSSAKQKASETFVVHLSAGKQDKVSFANLANGVNIERNIVDIFTRELF